MLREQIYEEIPVFSGADIHKILDMAQKSHERYLIKSNIKDLDKALVYYLEAVKLNPQLPEVHYKLASLLWEKGEIDINSAIKHCKKAIELAPHSSNARLHLGYFLRAAGRHEEAEKNFKEAIKLSRFRSSRPRLVLAATINERLKIKGFKLGCFLKSIYAFVTGLAMSVYDVQILKFGLRAVSEKSKILKCRLKAFFYKLVRNYQKAVDTYEKAADQTEQFDFFYTKIANLFIKLQNPMQAINFYRKGLDKSPDSVKLWANLADTLQTYEKRNISDIIECYNHVSRLEPENSKVYYELGHLHLRTENKFNSVNAFKKAIDIEPQNAFYHNSLAFALVQLQDYDGAINEYQKAIKINPDNEWTSIVSQALGAIYHQVKDNLDAAIVAYQTALLLDKNNLDALISLGDAYQDKNDIDNAIDCFCSAVKINPNSPKIFCNLGLLLWEKSYLDEAIVAYQKAISLKPDYAIAYNNLGVLYLDGKCEQENALTNFKAAIKHNPNYTLAYYNIGRAYEQLGDSSNAAEYYQMAFDINKLTDEMDEEEIQDRIHNLFCA